MRTYQAGVWRTRVELLLESLDESQREAFAAELRAAMEDVAGNDSAQQVWNGGVTMNGLATGQSRMYQLGQGTMNISES